MMWTTRFILLAFVLAQTTLALASEEIDLNQFAAKYFEAKIATQDPNATPKVLEQYLALLSDDVGYEHKPYRLLDEDVSGGKSRMREGMTYYLGGNDAYAAQLVSVAVGHNALAIQYQVSWSGRRGGQGPLLTENYVVMEVLELADGKVTLIRQFSD